MVNINNISTWIFYLGLIYFCGYTVVRTFNYVFLFSTADELVTYMASHNLEMDDPDLHEKLPAKLAKRLFGFVFLIPLCTAIIGVACSFLGVFLANASKRRVDFPHDAQLAAEIKQVSSASLNQFVAFWLTIIVDIVAFFMQLSIWFSIMAFAFYTVSFYLFIFFSTHFNAYVSDYLSQHVIDDTFTVKAPQESSLSYILDFAGDQKTTDPNTDKIPLMTNFAQETL